MASSTSPSKQLAPWQAIRLLLVAATAWALGAVYTLRLDPEIAFFRHGHEVKQAWRHRLDQDHPSKIVICGGSASGTSIDGARLLDQHRLPVLNLGLGAGMGAKVLTRYAFPALRRGDALLVGLEPDLLSKPMELETLGVKFSLATGQPELLREREGMPWLHALLDLRPGAYHALTLLGKIVLHQPLYRYQLADWQPYGWQMVTIHRDFPVPPISPFELSPDARVWLASSREWCEERGVRIAYLMPWLWSPPDQLAAQQRVNAAFLRDIALVMPVLKDPRLGAYPVREHYTDTMHHLSVVGVSARADELAGPIKAWTTWTVSELNEKCRAPD